MAAKVRYWPKAVVGAAKIVANRVNTNRRQVRDRIKPMILNAGLTVLALLTIWSPLGAEPRLIAIEECGLNGFLLGDTIEEMRHTLGEPLSLEQTKGPSTEYPHFEANYDGLRVVFSWQSQTALNFFVSSNKYRLRSGVGVGSNRHEVEAALGETSYYKSGDTLFMMYRLANADGQATPVQFSLELDEDIVIRMSVVVH